MLAPPEVFYLVGFDVSDARMQEICFFEFGCDLFFRLFGAG